MIENENPGSKIESRQSLDVSPRRTCPNSPGAADADGRDLKEFDSRYAFVFPQALPLIANDLPNCGGKVVPLFLGRVSVVYSGATWYALQPLNVCIRNTPRGMWSAGYLRANPFSKTQFGTDSETVWMRARPYTFPEVEPGGWGKVPVSVP
ncbi:hypothetical protein CDAR_211811 [Caerostris darwini]|uniref:Uncharacterized protein n=1 Tax=Caerostris darwini TaxID=1538125 RepID=A0AAV4PCM1_9ARAC|nr:hypothetical protein CDAR_211811 [Caerostris darwini]